MGIVLCPLERTEIQIVIVHKNAGNKAGFLNLRDHNLH